MRRTVFISLAEFPLLHDSVDHVDYSTTDEEIEDSTELRRGQRDIPPNSRLTSHYQNDPSTDPVPAFRKLSISESLGDLGGDRGKRTEDSPYGDGRSSYHTQSTTRSNLEHQRGTPNDMIRRDNIRKNSPLPPTTRRSSPNVQAMSNLPSLNTGNRRSIDVSSTNVDRLNYVSHDNRRTGIAHRSTPLYSDRMSTSTMEPSPSLVTLDDQRHDSEMRRILAKREERRRLSDGEQSRMSTPEVNSRQQRTPMMVPSSSRPDVQRRPSVPMQNDSSRRSTPMINRISPAIRSTAPNSSEKRAAELWNRMVSGSNH